MDPTSSINPFPLEETPASGTETPLHFLEKALGGLRNFQAFVTAYESGIFEACKKPAPLAAICGKAGTHPAITGPLCEGLVRTGFLSRDQSGNYQVTAVTRDFFLADSRFSQKAAIAQMKEFACLFYRLPDILQNGPIVYPRGEQFRERIIPAMAEQSRCGLVQRVAQVISSLPEFRSARRLLDLGGGHGLYAIALTRKNPDLSAVVFDLPEVTPATREMIRYYGAQGRITTHEGDFFRDPLGTGYDILFSSSNPSGKMPALIPKISDALNPGGLYLNKQVVDSTEEDPFADLEWNLWALERMKKTEKHSSQSLTRVPESRRSSAT